MPSKSDTILQAKLADLNLLRSELPDARGLAMLSTALRDRTNLVVARAAEIVGEWQLAALEPDLLAAYGRLAIDGVRRDPTCAGKIAIAEALQSLEYANEDFWLMGLHCSQAEPSWGPPVDTGARIRAISALSLAHTRYPEILLELTPLLQDPTLDARLGAIQAIAASGRPGAAPLLWLKLLVGDTEPEPYYEAFVALLILVPDRALPFVASFLNSDRPGVPETTALALGESRRGDALPYLKTALTQADDPAARRSIVLGIALLRLEEGMAFLLELITDGSDVDAQLAMKALEIVRHDERLWLRAELAYAARAG